MIHILFLLLGCFIPLVVSQGTLAYDPLNHFTHPPTPVAAEDFADAESYTVGQQQTFTWVSDKPFVRVLLWQEGHTDFEVLADDYTSSSLVWSGTPANDLNLGRVFFLTIRESNATEAVPLFFSRYFNLTDPVPSSTPAVVASTSSTTSIASSSSSSSTASSAGASVTTSSSESLQTSTITTTAASTAGSTASTGSSTGSSSPSTTSNPPSSNHTVAIGAGVGVGAGVVLIALIAGLIWFFRRRNKRTHSPPESTSFLSQDYYTPNKEQMQQGQWTRTELPNNQAYSPYRPSELPS